MRSGVNTCVKKVQRDIKGYHRIKHDGKPSGKPDIKCSICGKGHLTNKWYENLQKKQADSAKVGVGASGGSESKGIIMHRKLKHKERRIRVIICKIKKINKAVFGVIPASIAAHGEVL